MEILKPKNSITGLPSGPITEQEINQRIERQETMSVICIMVNHIKSFGEKYGFDLMDELIRELALIIKMAIHHLGSGDDFIGQMDFNNFVVVTRPPREEIISREIIHIFENDFKLLHYQDEDKKNGYMIHRGRKGETIQVPLISLAIGISSNEKTPFSNCNQAIHIASELQKKALTWNTSTYFKDRRTLLLLDNHSNGLAKS